MVTARTSIYSPISLHGRRVVLRTMTEHDYEGWLEVRERCHDWLLKWEPRRSAHSSHLAEDRRRLVSRCAIRERERQMGTGYGFGIFFEGRFVGEITLSSIQRGPLQSAYIGYWSRREGGGPWLDARSGGDHVAVRLRVAQITPSRDQHHSEKCRVQTGCRKARVALRGHRGALPRDRRRLGGSRPLRDDVRGVERSRPELVANWLLPRDD